MQNLGPGRYRARTAKTPADKTAALTLRGRCFRDGVDDRDWLDDSCEHLIVERVTDGRVMCTFRMLVLRDGRQIGRTYAAQHYDLAGLTDYPGKMVELGRFCVDPGVTDPEVLRVAWAAMTQYVDNAGVDLLFGCSSFQGTKGDAYLDTFSMLHDRHIAPPRWRPHIKAPQVFRFAGRLPATFDPITALRGLPPLLKTYLGMGGWVSDHAVVDEDLGTLHVFTGVEIAAIPPARARALRVLSGAMA